MDELDLAFAGIARQAELIRAREVSPLELVELYLRRIERLDGRLNSFSAVLAERTVETARRMTAGSDSEPGPLQGVPVAVKDNHDVEGAATGHGSASPAPPARADSELVRRLRAAGAIVIGKTTMPELASYAFTESAAHGVTRNPWNLDRTPGGSSGGSGAAVAAGLVGVATASDGGGSIRIPAANCGLFGLKPQRGRVSLMPLAEHWHGLSVAGCVTRSVRDTALFLDCVAGPAPGDAHRPPPLDRPLVDSAARAPGRLRVAVSRKPLVPVPVGAAALAVVDDMAERLRELGHQADDHDVPWGTAVLPAFVRYLRGIADEADTLARPRRLERRTQTIVRLGRACPDRLLRWTREEEARHARRIAALFERYDAVLSPVTARPQVEVLRWEGLGGLRLLSSMGRVVPLTSGWNLLGTPAAAVPAGISEDGLPRSVQIAGPANSEPLLVSLAAQIEGAWPWAARRPDFAAS